MYDMISDIPNITLPPQNQTTLQGDSVSIHCIANGLPAPNISWFIQQNDITIQLDNSQDFYINTYNVNENLTVSTLTLYAERLTQIWLLICNASNVIGEDTEAAYLTIYSKLTYSNVIVTLMPPDLHINIRRPPSFRKLR